MTGRNVNLALIGDEAKRNACLRRRSEGLAKKTEELATLCGVDAMMVVYYEGEPVVVWPPNPTKVIERYLALPAAERTENQTDMESYLIEQIKKVEEKMARQARTKKLEFDVLMYELHFGKGINNFDLDELLSLEQHLDQRIADLRHLELSKMNEGCASSTGSVPLKLDAVQGDEGIGSGSGELGMEDSSAAGSK